MTWQFAAFAVLFVIVLVLELIGVASKRSDDTITEGWRTLRDRLPAPVQFCARVFIAGFMLWAALHLAWDLV